jgi:hypothetical protein
MCGMEAHVSLHPCQVCPCGPLLLLLCTHMHIHFSSHLFFWGVAVGHGHPLHSWWWWCLWMPAGTFPWIVLAVAGPVPKAGGAHVVWRPVSVLTPTRSPLPALPWFHVVPLPWLAPSNQLRTGVDRGHDKLGAGVTQESHKKL